MKITINKPTEVDIKYLNVYCGDRVEVEDFQVGDDSFEDWDELFEKYPSLNDGNNDLYLSIDVDNGKIVNWPKNVEGYFQDVKVVDEGIYTLFDSKHTQISSYEGYVPSCLEISGKGYGDYWEFVVNKNGYIKNWVFDAEKANEIIN